MAVRVTLQTRSAGCWQRSQGRTGTLQPTRWMVQVVWLIRGDRALSKPGAPTGRSRGIAPRIKLYPAPGPPNVNSAVSRLSGALIPWAGDQRIG
jgi:hypothetical protein